MNLSLVLNWFELGTLVNVLNFDCLHMLWFVCACASRRGVLACFLLLPGWLGCFGFCAAGRKKNALPANHPPKRSAHLAGAEHDALELRLLRRPRRARLGQQPGVVHDQPLEAHADDAVVAGHVVELVEARAALGVAQQVLGRHDDERLAELAVDLLRLMMMVLGHCLLGVLGLKVV